MSGIKNQKKQDRNNHWIENIPSTDALKTELYRSRAEEHHQITIKYIICSCLVCLALAAFIGGFRTSVFRIYGNSMSPTMETGSLVLAKKTTAIQEGDVIGFYYNNKLLIKRVIAGPGNMVELDNEGNVYLNGHLLEESYISTKARGDCNLEFPYQVPDGKYFVMGDERTESLDSRNASIGCIGAEQVVGKITFCIWPITNIGPVH